MTRNFSNQRRDDMRPTPRNTSSGNYRDERSSRPARPRLSRDAVDRAWENGATRRYADYRPRQNASTPPNQRQGRPSPAFERSQPPYERRSYGDRREGYGAPPSSFQRNPYPQQRERRPEAGPRRFNEPGYRAPGNQSGPNGERWTRNPAPRRDDYRERYQDERPPRFNQRAERGDYRERYQDERPPRFNQRAPGGPEPSHYRAEDRPRPFERSERERENFARGRRPGAPRPGRDTYNPRWQSRPGAQREYQSHQEPRREYPETSRERPYRPPSRPGEAQFEGDYERFATDDLAERPEQTYEKHVTRLPDGRVIKGSRPWQRKQAQFWTEVEEESNALLPSSSALPDQSEQATPPKAQEAPAAKPARTRKQPASQTRKVKTVKTTRASKAEPRNAKAKAGKKKAGGPQGPVMRPSQRGFKWPAAGE